MVHERQKVKALMHGGPQMARKCSSRLENVTFILQKHVDETHKGPDERKIEK